MPADLVAAFTRMRAVSSTDPHSPECGYPDPPAKECNMRDELEIRNAVRGFIMESFLSGTDSEPLRDDDDLLLILDSLQILRMLIAFEGQYGVKIQDGDLTPENIGSVAKLAATIVRKQLAIQPQAVEL
jgi:acyl carrier protein